MLVSNYPVEVKDVSDQPSTPSTGEERKIRTDYNSVGRVRCYNCGQVGHISYDCAVPQVRKACFVCGNSGHFARDWYHHHILSNTNCDFYSSPQRAQVSVCARCNKIGHVTWQCPERPDHVTKKTS